MQQRDLPPATWSHYGQLDGVIDSVALGYGGWGFGPFVCWARSRNCRGEKFKEAAKVNAACSEPGR